MAASVPCLFAPPPPPEPPSPPLSAAKSPPLPPPADVIDENTELEPCAAAVSWSADAPTPPAPTVMA